MTAGPRQAHSSSSKHKTKIVDFVFDGYSCSRGPQNPVKRRIVSLPCQQTRKQVTNTKVRNLNVRRTVISYFKISLKKRACQRNEYAGGIHDMALRGANPGQRCQREKSHPCIAKTRNPEVDSHSVHPPSLCPLAKPEQHLLPKPILKAQYR